MSKHSLYAISIVILALPLAPVHAITASPITAITTPSADITLSFINPGRIAKVLVKQGNHVIAGQLLIMTGVRITTVLIFGSFLFQLQQVDHISSLRLSPPGSAAASSLVAERARPSAHFRRLSTSSLIVFDSGTVC